jgi:hypothetical protein
MRTLQLSVLIAVVAFATGCPNKPSKNFESNELVNNINAYLGNVQREADCYARSRTYDFSSKSCSSTSNPGGPAEAEIIRNQALDKALAVMDDNYSDFINNIETRRSRWGFIADVIDLGAGAATGIAKGERPNQILGIAITAFRGGRISSDINFYKQQTTPILISKMDDNRSKVQAVIITNKGKNIRDYSMQEAIRDMVTYYNAGTLVRAFTALAKDTAVDADNSERKVLRLKQIPEDKVFQVPEEVQDASILIGTFRRKYQSILSRGTAPLQDEARQELLAIYTDIATGEKKDDFKPVTDEMKKDAVFKARMDKLDSGDATQIKEVTTREIAELVFQVMSTAHDIGKDELIVTLKDVFVKRMS